MRSLLRTTIAGMLLLSLMTGKSSAEEACPPLKEIASLPVETLPPGQVYTTLTIKSQPVNFLLDTRVEQSLIGASTAAMLDLPREAINQVTRLKFCIDAGNCIHEFATTDALKLGVLTAKVRFGVAPDSIFASGVPAMLGADVLHNFDVEFDFMKSRVNLFSPDHCEGGVVYWTQSGASRIPLKVNSYGEEAIPAELDGESVDAEIATGFPKSELEMAEGETKFGMPDKDWKLVTAGDVHGRSTIKYEHVFKSMTLGGIQVNNVDLTIYTGPTPDYLGARLYLGLDILRQLHLYMAPKERNLYLSAADAVTPPLQQPQQPPPSTPPGH